MRSVSKFAVALALGGVACSPNSGGNGSGSAGQPGADDDDTPTTGAVTTSATTDVVDGSGTDSSGNASATLTTTDGVTTNDPPSTDDGDTTDGGSTDTGMGTTTDDPPPEQELLQNADFGTCGTPLWCADFESGSPFAQILWMQECFVADLTPPFALVELEADIATIAGTLDSVSVEVYDNTGDGPGGLLADQEVPVGTLAEGLHTITLDPPLTIGQQEICIGITGGGFEGALGIRTSDSSTDNVSYFEMDPFITEGVCYVPDWLDQTDIMGVEVGNWCIRGTIETL